MASVLIIVREILINVKDVIDDMQNLKILDIEDLDLKILEFIL